MWCVDGVIDGECASGGATDIRFGRDRSRVLGQRRGLCDGGVQSCGDGVVTSGDPGGVNCETTGRNVVVGVGEDNGEDGFRGGDVAGVQGYQDGEVDCSGSGVRVGAIQLVTPGQRA